MTEVEKMRALLAEARAITQDSLDSNTTGFENVNEVCDCNACERYRSIIQRIDAALAEPVGECARCETLRELADTAAAEQGLAQRRMMEAQKQRDEARAEVERLQKRLGDKAEMDSEKMAASFTEGTLAAGDAMRGNLRAVAERQREADTEAFSAWLREVHATGFPHKPPEALADSVDAGEVTLPLVTEKKS